MIFVNKEWDEIDDIIVINIGKIRNSELRIRTLMFLVAEYLI